MHVLLEKLGDLTVHIGDAELPVRADASQDRMHQIAFWVPAALVEPNGLTAAAIARLQELESDDGRLCGRPIPRRTDLGVGQ